MLQRLLIQNYALIENLDIDFSKGLSIITGETGAGKSILLGGLSLILGQRADTQALMNKDKKCIVEGAFLIKEYALQALFSTLELDYEEVTTIRREISPEGKSRAFVNDTPVNLNQLKELGACLVDIHSQHETLSLNNSAFQLSVVDAHAVNTQYLKEYSSSYTAYKEIEARLNALLKQEKQSKADLDYFQFQFNELEEARLVDGEQEVLEKELEVLNNTEQIKMNLAGAVLLLQGNEQNILGNLHEVKGLLAALSPYDTAYEELADRLRCSQIELQDIASGLEQLELMVSHHPDRVAQINERLNTLYHLQQKHRVGGVAALLSIQNDLSDKLYAIVSMDSSIEKLSKDLTVRLEALIIQASEISKKRGDVIPEIELAVKKLLAEVGMPDARLKIEHLILPEAQLNKTGIDSIRFLFSANKGSEFKELNKVASGGELSRLMLCIKAILAKLTALPTLIFDEIDTGVSGEVAFKVAKIIEVIAREHQVIGITHLPQMASKGDTHFFVYKENTNTGTLSKIKKLTAAERVDEVAKMLSGEKLSAAALENAKILLSGT
jgi:DNA repair protein RecN (Recombination protein N)